MPIFAKISHHKELHPAFEQYREQPGEIIQFIKERGATWRSGTLTLRFPDGRELGFSASDVDLINRRRICYNDVPDYREFQFGRGSPC